MPKNLGGRPRKSVAQKKLHGTFRPDREPKTSAKQRMAALTAVLSSVGVGPVPRAPRDLTKAECLTWNVLATAATAAGTLTDSSSTAFRNLVRVQTVLGRLDPSSGTYGALLGQATKLLQSFGLAGDSRREEEVVPEAPAVAPSPSPGELGRGELPEDWATKPLDAAGVLAYKRAYPEQYTREFYDRFTRCLDMPKS
jgi:hypothetical protein